MQRPDSVVFIVGARGSGKSSLAKQLIADKPRVIVWDPMREYAAVIGGVVVSDAAALLEAVKAKEPRIVFTPKMLDTFDAFCACAYLHGSSVVVDDGDTVVVVDELASVTSSGKAPGWWGRVLREGRHRKLSVVGISQRAAEIDKTIVGMSTIFYCFQLRRDADRKAMAADMGVDQSHLDQLQKLEYIAADDTGDKWRGKITFK